VGRESVEPAGQRVVDAPDEDDDSSAFDAGF